MAPVSGMESVTAQKGQRELSINSLCFLLFNCGYDATGGLRLLRQVFPSVMITFSDFSLKLGILSKQQEK